MRKIEMASEKMSLSLLMSSRDFRRYINHKAKKNRLTITNKTSARNQLSAVRTSQEP